MKIDILGTKYTIKEDLDIVKEGFDGVCKGYSKSIKIRPVHAMLDDNSTDEEKAKRYKEVMRHELIHAFFSESGLDEYSSNEQLVEWIAIQFPKMQKAFEQINCED